MDTTGTPRGPHSRHPTAAAPVGSFVANVLKVLLWTAVGLFVLSLARDEAGAQIPQAPSVKANADVAGREVKAGASPGGIQVEVRGSGTSVKAGASSGGAEVDASAGGANLSAGASSSGVEAEASGAGTSVKAGVSSDGANASVSGNAVRAGASLPDGGVKTTLKKADLDPVSGGVSGPLTGAGKDHGAGRGIRSATLTAGGEPRTPAGAGSEGFSPGPNLLPPAATWTSPVTGVGPSLAGASGYTDPSSGASTSLAGDHANGSPILPGASLPATTSPGGSWSPGGSPHAVLAVALMLAALGLFQRMRDGSWKPPLEPVRLLASPG